MNKKCLICKSPDVDWRACSLGSLEAEVPPPGDGNNGYSNNGSSDAANNGKQPWGPFLLTKLFNLSEEECKRLLEVGGVEGDQWIQLCGSCVQFVIRYRNRYEHLLAVQKELDGMRKEAIGKLLGLDGEEGLIGELESLTPTQERIHVRGYFRGVFDVLSGFHQASGSLLGIPINQAKDQARADLSSVVVGERDLGYTGGRHMSPPGEASSANHLMTTTEQNADHDHDRPLTDSEAGRSHIKTKGTSNTKTERNKDEVYGATLSISNIRSLNSATTTTAVHQVQVNENAENTSSSAEDEEDNSDEESTSVGSQEDESMVAFVQKKGGFSCGVCKKSFPSNRDLKRHSIVHTGEKRFVCPICGRRFGQKSTLKRHRIGHTQNPYVCSNCGKGFSDERLLTQHASLHGGRAHKCDICGDSFFRSWELTRHIRVHTQEKPFECTKCKKGFASLFNLKKHAKQKKPCS